MSGCVGACRQFGSLWSPATSAASISRACCAADNAPAVSPIASRDCAISVSAAALLKFRSGVTCPERVSSSWSARARSRTSLTSVAGIPILLRNRCARSKTSLFAVSVAVSECAFGALALLARYSLLLNGDAALPIGEARKSQCDDEAGGKASGQDIAAAGCPAAALAYERLRFFRRRRCVAWTRRDPAFGLFQSRRAQQQSVRTTCRRPVVRAFTVLGVVSDPVNISAQRFCEPFGALLEFGRIVKEDKIQPPQGLGRSAVIDAPTDDRCEPLVQGGLRTRLP